VADRFDDAVDAYRRGELEAALASFDALIESEPTALHYNWRGAVKHGLERYADAVADYDAALRLDPRHASARVNRGVVAMDEGDLDAAIADFSAALELAPEARVFRLRGRSRFKLGDLEGARGDLSEALRLAPDDENAYYWRARAAHADGDHDGALADFAEAIRLAPEDPSNYEWRASVWEALGEPDHAEADEQTAARLDNGDTMNDSRTLIHPLLQKHFTGLAIDDLAITERHFPARVRADLQRALDALIGAFACEQFSGVRRRYEHDLNFTQLLVRDGNDPALAVPPQYEEVDIGEEQPVRCLKRGMWLLADEQTRFAILLSQNPCDTRIELATSRHEDGMRVAQKVFGRIEAAIVEARSYRGKILSFEWQDSYRGTATGIKVHRLPAIEREHVILPARTLELLERNVIRFVGHRAELRRLGLATKKGLLFYGPPGTGKTHTIHYLAGALPGVTTLLISAEQVGALGEYMTLARLLQPSMVVIEDADLIARNRESMGSAIEEVLLNKLLNEMDGLREAADILLVLTTNRPEALEAALASRPGRIDQAIEFPFPDEDGRRKLIRLYARGATLGDDVIATTAHRLHRTSAAFIKELMRRAAQFQIEREGEVVTIGDVDNALDELLFRGGTLNRKLLGGEVTES